MSFVDVAVPGPWSWTARGVRDGYLHICDKIRSVKVRGGGEISAPAVSLPMMRVPAMLVWTMGITSPSSLSKAE